MLRFYSALLLGKNVGMGGCSTIKLAAEVATEPPYYLYLQCMYGVTDLVQREGKRKQSVNIRSVVKYCRCRAETL